MSSCHGADSITKCKGNLHHGAGRATNSTVPERCMVPTSLSLLWMIEGNFYFLFLKTTKY